MKKREKGFSCLRAAACIAIVCLHTIYVASRIYEEKLTSLQFTASRTAVNCLMWAVPCFVMVSGALLLQPGRELTFKKLFGSYLIRVVGALAAFTLIFQLVDLLMNQEAVTLTGIAAGWKNLMLGSSWSHLWYLYLMIGIYLLLPFYRKAAAHSSRGELLYLLAVYFIFLSVLPLMSSAAGIRLGFYLHVSTIYPFYLFAGYYLYSFRRERLSTGLSLVLLLAAFCGIIVLSIAKYRFGLFETEDFWGYSSPLVILQAVGMFGLFLNLSEHVGSFVEKVLLEIDRCSFGIYLIHMIFVRILIRGLHADPYGSLSVLRFCGLILGITAVSWGITGILKVVPGIKKIL